MNGITGNLNQEELTRRLSPILNTTALEHAHNQFIFAIYGNIFRDPPEPGVASWVSANDKPTSVTKPAGDEAEKRLKHEVMQLSRRERKRLKTIQETPFDEFTNAMVEYHNARTIKAPDVGPVSAGGYQKTSMLYLAIIILKLTSIFIHVHNLAHTNRCLDWDLEIRKRYTQPLFTETHEFPDTESISARMLPICYENGLPGGSGADCASFMNTATEIYIKEALTNFLSRVTSNGDKYIKIASYKRAVEKDEERVARGEIGRTAGGYLPVELEEMRKRKPLCMEDIRLALDLGDSYLGQVPLIAGQIANGRYLDAEGVDPPGPAAEEPIRPAIASVAMQRSVSGAGAVTNGVAARAPSQNGVAAGLGLGLQTGFRVDLGDPMQVDEEWGWNGGQVGDLEGLDSVLDGCLAVGV